MELPVASHCRGTVQACGQHHLVRVEAQVWRHGRVAGTQAEGTGGGEWSAQTAAGGRHARQCRAEGSRGKNW